MAMALLEHRTQRNGRGAHAKGFPGASYDFSFMSAEGVRIASLMSGTRMSNPSTENVLCGSFFHDHAIDQQQQNRAQQRHQKASRLSGSIESERPANERPDEGAGNSQEDGDDESAGIVSRH